MGLFDESTEKKLNNLIEKAYDAKKGFKKAAEIADNPRLKSFFNNKARQRGKYANELSESLGNQGMEVSEKDGSIAGSVHRSWIDTKAFFSSENEKFMIEEVRIGEKKAINDYNDIMKNCELNPSVRDMLLRQKNEIQSSYNNADYLEDIH